MRGLEWTGVVWGSISEPRIVSAIMVVVYATLGMLGASVLRGPGTTPMDVVTACCCLLMGMTLGVPGACRGAWWLEAGALVFSALGLSALTVIDIARSVTVRHWPGYPELLSVAMVLMLLVRWVRIRTSPYAPGRWPDTPLRQAQRRATVAVAMASQVIDSHDGG